MMNIHGWIIGLAVKVFEIEKTVKNKVSSDTWREADERMTSHKQVIWEYIHIYLWVYIYFYTEGLEGTFWIINTFGFYIYIYLYIHIYLYIYTYICIALFMKDHFPCILCESSPFWLYILYTILYTDGGRQWTGNWKVLLAGMTHGGRPQRFTDPFLTRVHFPLPNFHRVP